MTTIRKQQPSSNNQQTIATFLGTLMRLLLSMMMAIPSPVWKASRTYAMCNLVGFLISVLTGSHVHLDLIGTGAFAVAAWPYIGNTNNNHQPQLHSKWSARCIFLWSTKLASFLFYRAIRLGHDARLTEQLATVQGMCEFWCITFTWNLCTTLPYLLGMTTTTNKSKQEQKSEASNDHNTATTTTSSYYSVCLLLGGAMMFVAGLTMETLADAQKWFFKRSHASNEFCNVGLWSLSQHPNFFGNLLLTVGILVMNLPALTTTTTPITTSKATSTSFPFQFLLLLNYWKFVVALISPLFLLGLFYGQAQGDILNAVDLANAKYGHDPNYEVYLREVPLIVPKLF
jgi:steroid 5-alpha reductase family enzyme